ncbi:hypothetical protein O181_017777 [Austropuccinia psidii MF-1]|uniref:Uncharacterized protein n=1 Tax=Austropuccinia psidii MF-1 TaxID=1389203 RepID=A0A9Q3GSW1_9BASI|nr:hypothetical protein [Austropuccinia psidii MF-1]
MHCGVKHRMEATLSPNVSRFLVLNTWQFLHLKNPPKNVCVTVAGFSHPSGCWHRSPGSGQLEVKHGTSSKRVKQPIIPFDCVFIMIGILNTLVIIKPDCAGSEVTNRKTANSQAGHTRLYLCREEKPSENEFSHQERKEVQDLIPGSRSSIANMLTWPNDRQKDHALILHMTGKSTPNNI